MVFEKASDDTHQTKFLIRPNRSMTATGMIIFVCLVGFAVLLVAIRFVVLGAWMVLPFAVLEIGLIAAGFWLYERASRYRETVQISSNNILVTQESVRGHSTCEFDPHWVQVTLREDPRGWYPSRLLVRSKSKQVEIGACLTNYERVTLSAALIKSMARSRLGVAT